MRWGRWGRAITAVTGGALALAAGGISLATEPPAFTSTQRGHWAWKAPRPSALPKVRYAAWVANPIDAFVLAKLEAAGLKPAPTASREELIRRLTFDLTGLPPTPAEIDRFLEDRSPQAYEKLVDRLLASPAYGERWARHWLDLARYADTNGYEHDEVRPDAWRYRDYVVRSFNADKPYDRFVREQIAGDQIAPEEPDARIATGFTLLGPDMTDAADQAARRQNTLNDMTDTTALVFLGLTAGCARCHDHKYEPLPQTDYYRLQAFFVGAQFRKDLPVATAAERAVHARAMAEYDAKWNAARAAAEAAAGDALQTLREEKLARLPEDVQTAIRLPEAERTAAQQVLVNRHSKTIEPSPEEVAARLPAGERERYLTLAGRLKAVAAEKPAPLPVALGLEEGPAPPTYLLERGEPANRGAEVHPGFPIILTGSSPSPAPAAVERTGRRAALAEWIAGPGNPLTARVLVNRLWQHHFGRGIVGTPNDFGVRGEEPTHPELLDWLAGYFVAGAGGSLGARGQGPGAGGNEPGDLGQHSGLNGEQVEHRSNEPVAASRDTQSPGPRPLAPGPQTGAAWSMKKMHRLILTSNAYKQSSRASEAALAADPDNRLFSRMNRRRLEAEPVRDAALFVSGRLNPKMGGPGVFPPIPPEARPDANSWPVSRDPADHTRRSLYVFVRRNLKVPDLEVFDSPDTNLSCGRREVTTTAPQALALLNAPEMQENARGMAGRIYAAAADDPARITLAYRMALGRRPTAEELQIGQEFLERQAGVMRRRRPSALALPAPMPAGLDPAAGAAFVDYCLALMNLNEFVYVD